MNDVGSIFTSSGLEGGIIKDSVNEISLEIVNVRFQTWCLLMLNCESHNYYHESYFKEYTIMVLNMHNIYKGWQNHKYI